MSAPPMNPALAMQMNVKQNAQEINSYLKDLQSWSSDVKKKDAALKSGDLTLTKTPIAPIRGSAAASSGSAAKAAPVLLPSSASADQLRFAESKAAGNKAFAAGAFEDSLSHYATCMILDPSDAIVPSNRAQALLKLQRWHEAEVDASTALALDSSAVKALFRRAQARRHLRKFAGSLSDCQLLAKLDPTNKAAQALAVEVEALLKKQQEAKLKASQPIVSASPVAPIAAAAAASSKAAPASAAASSSAAPATSLPAGRRMVIQEEDDDDEDVEEVITPAAAAATAAANAAAANKAATAAPRAAATPSAAPFAAPSAAAASSTAASSASSASAASKPAVAKSAAPAAAAPASPAAAAAGSGGVSLRAPKTAYDFDSAFREIRGDPVAVAAYFALLPSPIAAPAAYPALLKTALSSTLLREVVEALSAVIVPEGKWTLARDVLMGVAAVPRFATVRMMMEEADKQTLKLLLTSMQNKATQGQMEGTTKETVQTLAKSWGVAI